MPKRKRIIYGIIYIGVAVAFPSLPIGGIKFIIGFFTGGMAGVAEGGTGYLKDKVWDTLNPFN